MPKRNHVHKLKLHTFKNGTKAFFCVDDCDYRIDRELALGKMTICFRCGQPFQLNQYSLGLVKPHCEACHVSKSSKPRIGQVMNATAVRIENDLKSRMGAITGSDTSEVKSEIKMLTEDELL